jgi:hypothetical protein
MVLLLPPGKNENLLLHKPTIEVVGSHTKKYGCNTISLIAVGF